MREDISPEERLLRLVKHGAKKPAEKQKPIATLGIFKRLFEVRYLNYILLFFLFLSLVNLALNLLLPRKPDEIKTQPTTSSPEESEKDKDLLPKTKSYDYYAQEIGKRNLFIPSIGKKEEGAPAGEKPLSLREIIQDFSLIGIMQGDNPQAIIEDKKAKKTYFLKRQDYLGQIKVSDIQEGKVILEYQGESFDLFL